MLGEKLRRLMAKSTITTHRLERQLGRDLNLPSLLKRKRTVPHLPRQLQLLQLQHPRLRSAFQSSIPRRHRCWQFFCSFWLVTLLSFLFVPSCLLVGFSVAAAAAAAAAVPVSSPAASSSPAPGMFQSCNEHTSHSLLLRLLLLFVVVSIQRRRNPRRPGPTRRRQSLISRHFSSKRYDGPHFHAPFSFHFLPMMRLIASLI